MTIGRPAAIARRYGRRSAFSRGALAPMTARALSVFARRVAEAGKVLRGRDDAAEREAVRERDGTRRHLGRRVAEAFDRR